MHHLADWIRDARARGWGDALDTALDILAPLGALSAQVVWVAQPVLHLFVPRDAIGELATLLETPDGVETLRRLLEEDPP
jgi:hypothetical protein